MKPLAMIGLILAAATLGCAPARPELQQSVEGLHRPESCTFSLDGTELFITSVASGTYGPDETFLLVRGQGFISKLRVGPEGRAEMVDRHFVKGLDAPLGTTVLPKATLRFPAGTLFVNVGFWLQGTAEGNYTQDPEALGTGITAIDPKTGRVLGHIAVGEGSQVAKALGFACYGLNGATFDADGNFYAAESGKAPTTDPPRTGRAGILRIDHDALDALAAGQPADGVAFQPLPFGPNGVTWRTEENALYAVTSGGGDDPRNQAVFRIPADPFPLDPPPALATGLGKLDAVVFTPAGTPIVSRMAGDLARLGPDFQRRGDLGLGLQLDGPSDIKLQALPDGTSLLAVPEQAPQQPAHQQRLLLIRLPAGF